MSDAWTRGLIGLLVVAFSAWAGVVWSSAEAVKGGISQIQIRLGTLEDRIGYFSSRLERHEDTAWHDVAGLEISVLRSKMDAVEAQHGKNLKHAEDN